MYSLKMKDLIRDFFKGITPNYVDHSNVIVLNQKCIRNNQIDFSLARFHDSKKTYPSKKELQVGDILINSTGAGTAGRCAFIRELPKNYSVVADSHILVVRISDFFIAGCVQYGLFNIEKLLQTFLDGSTGQGEFDKQRLLNVIIPIPNNPKYIYQFLSNLDKKIVLNKQINARLEEMAKTLYDYWFVQFDFPDASGKPYKSSGGDMVFDETLKREIPKGWEVKSLGEIENNIITGKTPSTQYSNFFNGDIPFITIGDIRNNTFIIKTEQNLSIEGANNQKNKYLPEGSLCVSCIATVGLIGFTTRQAQTNQQINSIIFKHDYNKEFLYFYLKDYFLVGKAKTGNTFANMNKGDFEKILVLYPNLKLLQKYSNKMVLVFNQINNLSKQNHQLTQLRDFLLPMLMNGQVSVAK